MVSNLAHDDLLSYHLWVKCITPADQAQVLDKVNILGQLALQSANLVQITYFM